MNTPEWDTLNLHELIGQLKTVTNEVYTYDTDSIYEFLDGIEYPGTVRELLQEREVTLVDGFGGTEGYDEQEYWVIIKVGSRHIKISGWYSSWTGPEIEWSNAHFVEEQPVTKTEWVRV